VSGAFVCISNFNVASQWRPTSAQFCPILPNFCPRGHTALQRGRKRPPGAEPDTIGARARAVDQFECVINCCKCCASRAWEDTVCGMGQPADERRFVFVSSSCTARHIRRPRTQCTSTANAKLACRFPLLARRTVEDKSAHATYTQIPSCALQESIPPKLRLSGASKLPPCFSLSSHIVPHLVGGRICQTHTRPALSSCGKIENE